MNTTYFGSLPMSRRLALLSALDVRLQIARNECDGNTQIEVLRRIRDIELLPLSAPIALSREEADIAYPESVDAHYGVAA